jgi:hypothetical protein
LEEWGDHYTRRIGVVDKKDIHLAAREIKPLYSKILKY